jgi:hypothetical protein
MGIWETDDEDEPCDEADHQEEAVFCETDDEDEPCDEADHTFTAAVGLRLAAASPSGSPQDGRGGTGADYAADLGLTSANPPPPGFPLSSTDWQDGGSPRRPSARPTQQTGCNGAYRVFLLHTQLSARLYATFHSEHKRDSLAGKLQSKICLFDDTGEDVCYVESKKSRWLAHTAARKMDEILFECSQRMSAEERQREREREESRKRELAGRYKGDTGILTQASSTWHTDTGLGDVDHCTCAWWTHCTCLLRCQLGFREERQRGLEREEARKRELERARAREDATRREQERVDSAAGCTFDKEFQEALAQAARQVHARQEPHGYQAGKEDAEEEEEEEVEELTNKLGHRAGGGGGAPEFSAGQPGLAGTSAPIDANNSAAEKSAADAGPSDSAPPAQQKKSRWSTKVGDMTSTLDTAQQKKSRWSTKVCC